MTPKALLAGVFALAFALAIGYVIVDDSAADADDAPAITWEVANADNGVQITYTIDKVATEAEIKAIVGSDKFDATYVAPYEYKDKKSIADVPSGLVKYIGDKTITVPIDTYATLKTALADIATIDETKAKTIVNYVIPSSAKLYTPAEITAIEDAVKATYKDYVSPEDVEKAVADALAKVSDLKYTEEELEEAVAAAVAPFEDYMSPEDVQAAVDKAVEDYKAANPAVVEKADNTALYVIIGVLAIVAALFGIIAMLGMRKAHAEGRTLF